MVLLIVLSSILIGIVTLYQVRKESKEYHQSRLERKENAIREHIMYVIRNTTFPVESQNIPYIFKTAIREISDIHSMEINFYDFNGKLLINSHPDLREEHEKKFINKKALRMIDQGIEKKYETLEVINDQKHVSSYSVINNEKFKPVAILELPYIEDETEFEEEIETFMKGFAQIYFFLIVISVILSYFLSNYITNSLRLITDKLSKFKLNKRNEKIEVEPTSKEIELMINSYNDMVDQLEDSAIKLAQSERELAWKEMAKQVAHEIKNPLTPMKLTIQSFQRKFDKNDPDFENKFKTFTQSMLEQIEVMSEVAGTFSTFATMPSLVEEKVNLIEAAKSSINMFEEDFITLTSDFDDLEILADKNQIIRVFNNLIKNAVQAIKNAEKPEIKIEILKFKSQVLVYISDNGCGIKKENLAMIFEPKFTTKTSGMGLGLVMVKNIIENLNGQIAFESKENIGTTFKLIFPLHRN
jgi:nitrogen fixation/metabolism regulation signal transduction histidine kinase